MNIEELKEAVNNSNMTTKAKADVCEILKLYVDTTELLKAKNASIRTLVKMHTRVPRIYYAVAAYGIGSATFGIFSVIHFAVICGIALFLVALIGILEVVYTRRKIEDITE
jgi:hypothetical protein